MNFRAKKFHFKELKSVKFFNFPPKNQDFIRKSRYKIKIQN